MGRAPTSEELATATQMPVDKIEKQYGFTAPREKAFLLARPEQRLLEAIARRLPAFVRPDHLTVLALAAAVAFAVAAASGWFSVAAGLH